jgi:excisionase family DNA binding protein
LTVISIAVEVNTRRVRTPPFPRLVRPSQLARFWELNPRTVLTWIRQGRLVAIRSPGNHFRLRVSDVRAFCEREGLAVPPFVAPPPKRTVLATPSDALARTVARALRGNAVLEVFRNPYEALVAAAALPTALFALSASFPKFDGVAAIRALKALPAASNVAVVVFDLTSRAQLVSADAAGAVRSITRAREPELPGVLRELLEIEPAG